MYLEVTPTYDSYYRKIDRRLRKFKLLPVPGFADVNFFKKEQVSQFDESGDYTASVYGNGVYVSVSGSSNKVLVYNPSNKTYTVSTIIGTNSGSALAFGNNVFVSMSENLVLTSSDGLEWNISAELPEGWSSKALIYTDKFVALPNEGTKGFYSVDGTTWTEFSIPINQSWRALSYGDGVYVALAYNTNVFMNSKDGISWYVPTGRVLPMEGEWCSIAFGHGKFLAVGKQNRTALTSVDGETWLKINLVSSFYNFSGNLACFSGEYFILLDSQRGQALFSADARSFVVMSTDNTNWTTVASYNDEFFFTTPSLSCHYKFTSLPSENNTVTVLKGSEVFFRVSAFEYFPRVGSQIVTKNYMAAIVLDSFADQAIQYCGTFSTASEGVIPLIMIPFREKIAVTRVSGTFVTSSGDTYTLGINSLRKES